MNRAALERAELKLRVIPPRAGCKLFPLPPDYERVLSGVQRLRGSRYLADGAISAQALDDRGQHVTAEDEKSYHIVLCNGDVEGCLRVQLHPRPGLHVEEYRVYDLVRRMSGDLRGKYHAAMEEFIQTWRLNDYEVGECGGWAASNRYKANLATLALPLAGWSLSRILTRQIWIASATERNGSAEMLKRIGGWRLKLGGEELPHFYDAAYNCHMELLCFNSEILNPKFEQDVTDLQHLIEEQITK